MKNDRRLWTTLMLAVLCVFTLSQCEQGCTYSLHPLYTDKDLYLDDSIIGTWKGADDGSELQMIRQAVITVKRSKFDPKAYDVEWTNREHTRFHSLLHLTRLGPYTFADFVAPDASQSKGAGIPFPNIRLHSIAQIRLEPNVASLRFIFVTPAVIEKQVLPIAVQVDSSKEKNTVIVSPTEKLQAFAIEQANKFQILSAKRVQHPEPEEVPLVAPPFIFCRETADCPVEGREMALKEAPMNSQTAYDLALEYLKRNRFEDASATWRRAPANGENIYDYALAHGFLEAGHRDEAVAVVKSSMEGGSPEKLSCSLGYLYLGGNLPAEATKAFDKCPVRSGAALAYEQLGDFLSARRELEKVGTVENFGPYSRFVIGILRGTADFAENNYPATDATLSTDRKFLFDPDEGAPELYWRYLALIHQGKRQEADLLLNQKMTEVFGFEITFQNPYTFYPMPYKITGAEAYLRNELDETAFISKQPSLNESLGPQKKCMAYFIIAEKHLLAGDRSRAIQFFHNAVYTHAMNTPAWIISNARLGQLRS